MVDYTYYLQYGTHRSTENKTAVKREPHMLKSMWFSIMQKEEFLIQLFCYSFISFANFPIAFVSMRDT